MAAPRQQPAYDDQEELLRFAFVDPLSDEPQVYPPSETFEQIHERITGMFLETSLFGNAYSDLDVSAASTEGRVFKLDYRLQNIYTAQFFHCTLD